MPATSDRHSFNTVSFEVTPNFNFLYLPQRSFAPLRLDFKSDETNKYLFDIASFKIDNGSQTAGFNFNDTIDATSFSDESHPGDDFNVRDMGHKVGYINNGNSIRFRDFRVGANSTPTSVEVTYSSAGIGGDVEFLIDSADSANRVGPSTISLGKFSLPPTGGWEAFQTVTIDIPPSVDFLYLRNNTYGVAPLTLEFTNAQGGNGLFDIQSFKINAM